MDKAGLKQFDCFSEPATLGTRWTRWLTSFELFVDGKGLIVTNNTTLTHQQYDNIVKHYYNIMRVQMCRIYFQLWQTQVKLLMLVRLTWVIC